MDVWLGVWTVSRWVISVTALTLCILFSIDQCRRIVLAAECEQVATSYESKQEVLPMATFTGRHSLISRSASISTGPAD